MADYEYTLRFSLPPSERDADDLDERLFAGGCDDALIGIGRPGLLALDFTRRAASAREAMMSAVADVRRAVPGAELIEVSPDLVGATDVADAVGCSRQNIRKLMLARRSNAPAPVHEGTQAIWHLALVLDWLAGEKGYDVDRQLRDVAGVAMHVNAALGVVSADRGMVEEIRALLV